jgi:hypothetical protein
VAEEMHRLTLGLREKALGSEHPDTLVSMNNLAGVLRDQGKYEAAKEYLPCQSLKQQPIYLSVLLFHLCRTIMKESSNACS